MHVRPGHWVSCRGFYAGESGLQDHGGHGVLTTWRREKKEGGWTGEEESDKVGGDDE